MGCPYRPAGSNAWVDLLVLAAPTDTIRTAHVEIHSNSSRTRDTTITLTAANQMGRYRLGPLHAGEYHLQIRAEGYQMTERNLGICRDFDARLIAKLTR